MPDHLQAERPVASPGKAGSLTYEPYYGLFEKPFSLSADPRFLYKSLSHAPIFDNLLTAIRRREGLIVLTGDIGTGKTTMCRSVIEHLDRKTFSCFVPDPFMSREDLLKTLLIDFGVMSVDDLKSGRLKGASRLDLSYLLYEFLDSLVPLNAVAVIVLDEAQNLSVPLLEEVRILSDLERRAKLLQVVLVGQLELQARLKLPEMRQVDQRVAMRCELTPLDRKELTRYVAHRLNVAGGGSSRVWFSPSALDMVYETSGGVPRVINLICDRALHRGSAHRTLRIEVEIVSAAIVDLGLREAAAVAEMAVATIQRVRYESDAATLRSADGLSEAVDEEPPKTDEFDNDQPESWETLLETIDAEPPDPVASDQELPAAIEPGEQREEIQTVVEQHTEAEQIPELEPVARTEGTSDWLPMSWQALLDNLEIGPTEDIRVDEAPIPFSGSVPIDTSTSIVGAAPSEVRQPAPAAATNPESKRPPEFFDPSLQGFAVELSEPGGAIGNRVLVGALIVILFIAGMVGTWWYLGTTAGAKEAWPLASQAPLFSSSRDTIETPSASGALAEKATPRAADQVAVSTGAALYFIQVASFENPLGATRLVNELAQVGYRAGEVEVDLGERGRFRQVLVGGYGSRADAERDLQRLREIPAYSDARLIEPTSVVDARP